MRFQSVPLLSAALLLLATIDSNEKRSNVAHAQVSVPGTFPANYAETFYIDASLNTQDLGALDDGLKLIERTKIQGPPPVLQLPHLDNAQLLNEEKYHQDELLEQGMEPDGAYQFGKAISIESFDMTPTLSSGRWIPLKILRQQQVKVTQRQNRYPRVDEDDVMVWQLEIHSKSALSLNLIFSDFHIPKGTEFYVSGKKHVLGAFTAEINNKPDGVFATAPISGDKLLLEFYTPKQLLQQGLLPRIQLSHIVHGYKPTLLASSSDITAKGFREQDGSITATHNRDTRFKDQSSPSFGVWPFFPESIEDPPIRAMSGKCNIDIACHQTKYYEQGRSVGVILTNYNQKYCTGALINNVRQDGKQLFLTANHCSGYTNTTEHIVMFNHEKIRCGPNSEEINEHDTAMGLVKLGNYAASDYTVYEIMEPIPDAYNVYLAGWSALSTAPSSRLQESPSDTLPSDGDNDDGPTKSPWRTSRVKINNSKKDPQPVPPAPPAPQPPSNQLPIVGIHHPSGDSKKISFYYNGTLPKACWSECGTDDSYYHWQIPRWDIGTTEPGSSGSPLFDADKRIVGQLHGGSASCWNKDGYDVYGAIHASFTKPPKTKNRLSTYLDPDETGAKFMDGYSLERARRETRERERQRDGESSRPSTDVYDTPMVVEPLGRVGMEKPLANTGAKKSCHSFDETEELFTEQNTYSEKMPRIVSRLWQKLINELRNYEEY
ncbi:hypothetical protein BGZ76_003425 [Entomortierella beljakovae]|nr:hypothetical protein BGZ76_003425 [Entomortierella beljakovae]